MTSREKTLVVAVGVLVLLIGLLRGLSGYQETLRERRTDLQYAQQQLSEAQVDVARGILAESKLTNWR